MKIFAIFSLLGVLIGYSASSAAQTSGAIPGSTEELITRVVAQVEHHIDAGTAPGAAVVLVSNGAIQHAQGYGFATLPNQPATAQTVFSLGSVSKNYVGFAINKLAAMGKLQLDDEVGKHLPTLALDNPFNKPVTIRHLLNHSSGFSTFTGNRNQREVDVNDSALAESLVSLASHPLQSEPGSRFEYSNANYQILGVVIEQLTGQSFPQAMNSLVFESLQLQRTRIGHDASQPETATGYRFWLTAARPYPKGLGSALEPQGGVSSTVLDMGRYLVALTGGNNNVPDVYEASWADTFPTEVSEVGYGPGWSVRKRPVGPLFYHHGLNPGFSAVLAFDPASGLGVGLAVNASDGFVAGDVAYFMESVVAEVFPELAGAQAIDTSSRWLGLLALFVLLGGIVLWVIWFLSAASKQRSAIRTVLPSAALLGFAALLGVWLPPAIQIPIGGAAMFSPDIGWTLLLLLWCSGGWAVLRLVLIWRQRIAKLVD